MRRLDRAWVHINSISAKEHVLHHKDPVAGYLVMEIRAVLCCILAELMDIQDSPLRNKGRRHPFRRRRW